MTAERCKVVLQESWDKVVCNISDGYFDLIYTDPPYGMSYVSNIPGDKRWNKSGSSKSSFLFPIHGDTKGGVDWSWLARECFRLLKNDRYMFLHCNLNVLTNHVCHFEKAGFKMKGACSWNKTTSLGGDISGAMKRDWEPLLYMTKGKPAFREVDVLRKGETVKRRRISEIKDWKFVLPKSEQCRFPTQKPLALCKQVIQLATDVGDVIFDPFAGSGSALVAAEQLGRDYLGSEIDPDAFRILEGRLSHGKMV